MASSGVIGLEIENPIKNNKPSDNRNRKSIRRQSTIQHVKKHTRESAFYPKGAIIKQVAGATGVVATDCWGDRLTFTTTSGKFNKTGGDLIISTPTENIEGTHWNRYGKLMMLQYLQMAGII